MALIKASDAAKRVVKKDLPTYIGERVEGAVSNGWSSTKMWIRNDNEVEAKGILKEAGYTYKTLEVEENSKQLEVSW